MERIVCASCGEQVPARARCSACGQVLQARTEAAAPAEGPPPDEPGGKLVLTCRRCKRNVAVGLPACQFCGESTEGVEAGPGDAPGERPKPVTRRLTREDMAQVRRLGRVVVSTQQPPMWRAVAVGVATLALGVLPFLVLRGLDRREGTGDSATQELAQRTPAFVSVYGALQDVGGPAALTEALEDAPVLPGKILILTSRGGRWQDQVTLDPLHIRLAPAARAEAPREVKTIVWVERSWQEAVRYEDGTVGLRAHYRLSLIDWERRVVFARRELAGGEPPAVRPEGAERAEGSPPDDAVIALLHGLSRR